MTRFLPVLLGVLLLAGSAPRVTARAAGPLIHFALPSVCSGFILHLEPGIRKPDGSIDHAAPPAPSNMPKDPVLAELPLYPGASRANTPLRNPDYRPVVTAYLKTAAAEYAVPAAIGDAVAWYTRTFVACGYRHYYSSEGSGPEGITRGLRFMSPTTPNMSIALSFQPVSATETLLLYYAYAVSLPPRPRGSIIALAQKDAQIKYVLPDGHHAFKVEIRDRASLFTLVNAVDGLETIDAEAHTCFSANQGYAMLDFRAPNGKRTRVLVLPGCRDVLVDHYPRLVDDNLSVWSAVGLVVYRHCMARHCKKSKVKA